jgi:hypothetical protein
MYDILVDELQREQAKNEPCNPVCATPKERVKMGEWAKI